MSEMNGASPEMPKVILANPLVDMLEQILRDARLGRSARSLQSSLRRKVSFQRTAGHI